MPPTTRNATDLKSKTDNAVWLLSSIHFTASELGEQLSKTLDSLDRLATWYMNVDRPAEAVVIRTAIRYLEDNIVPF